MATASYNFDVKVCRRGIQRSFAVDRSVICYLGLAQPISNWCSHVCGALQMSAARQATHALDAGESYA